MLFGDTVSLQFRRDAFSIALLNPQLSIDNINTDHAGVDAFVFLVSPNHPQVTVSLTVNDDFVYQIPVSTWHFMYAHERPVIQFPDTFLRVPFDDNLLGFVEDNQFEIVFSDC